MYERLIESPRSKSFFLFGPRGTGKTTWLKTHFPQAIYIDLLEATQYNACLSHPENLEKKIPKDFADWVIIDEVQRVPALLNEVHRLIEGKSLKFILTGSSARKLRSKQVNLLAGRALTYNMYPLTIAELGKDFDLGRSLEYGHLPAIIQEEKPKRYLESYVMTYLKQEVEQEGLTRNLEAFSRFLEAVSFSQGSLLSFSHIARECAVSRKNVENYFSILEDLLIARTLPIFSKKAKRRLVRHSKFYFFDVGIYQTLRPKGAFDRPEEIKGTAVESLVYQELCAINHYLEKGYDLYFWRTSHGVEVDFVLYGEKGLKAIEVKSTKNLHPRDLNGLKAFKKDYPMAKGYILYGGDEKLFIDDIEILPIEKALRELSDIL